MFRWALRQFLSRPEQGSQSVLQSLSIEAVAPEVSFESRTRSIESGPSIALPSLRGPAAEAAERRPVASRSGLIGACLGPAIGIAVNRQEPRAAQGEVVGRGRGSTWPSPFTAAADSDQRQITAPQGEWRCSSPTINALV